MLSFRLIHDKSLRGRSQCVTCNNIIAWYDLFPVISWVILRGSCRSCHTPISFLYPFIELLTLCLFGFAYWYLPSIYWAGYTIFFSALLITIRSDIDSMLISRFVTLFLIPVGMLLSRLQALPITITQSIAGALTGYIFFWTVGTLFTCITKKEGIGEGDLDLLAFIGSFTGIIGCWISVLIGSITASVAGLLYIASIYTKKSYSLKTLKIPFGPFLALGAILYVFFQEEILSLLYNTIYLTPYL